MRFNAWLTAEVIPGMSSVKIKLIGSVSLPQFRLTEILTLDEENTVKYSLYYSTTCRFLIISISHFLLLLFWSQYLPFSEVHFVLLDNLQSYFTSAVLKSILTLARWPQVDTGCQNNSNM